MPKHEDLAGPPSAESWTVVACALHLSGVPGVLFAFDGIFCVPLVKSLEKDVCMKMFCAPDTKKKGKTIFTIIFLW